MLLQLIPKSDSNWGMCMALRLSEHCVSPANSARGVVCWAGYESGMVVLWSCDVKPSIMHEKQLQSEPIMAMCVAPDNLGKPSSCDSGILFTVQSSSTGQLRCTDVQVWLHHGNSCKH